MADMDQEQLEAVVAQAYSAYAEAMGGRDELHRPFPPYADMHDSYKQAWRQAVMAALTAPPAAPAPEAPPPATKEDEEDKDGRSRGRRSS